MKYKGFNIKWRVFEYNMEEDDKQTVRFFESADEAAKFCINHFHSGVEMIAFPIKKGEPKP